MQNQNISTISLDEALDLFKLPFDLKEFEGKPVSVGSWKIQVLCKMGEKHLFL